MKSVNRVTLLGYIGSMSDLYESDNGTSYLFISIATVKAVKKGKKWEEITEWNSVSVWGSAADFVHEYLDVGDRVWFEGRVETKKTGGEDDDGNPVYKTYIGGRHIIPLTPKNDGGDDSGGEKAKGKQKGKAKGKSRSSKGSPPEPDFLEDDIPF